MTLSLLIHEKGGITDERVGSIDEYHQLPRSGENVIHDNQILEVHKVVHDYDNSIIFLHVIPK